LLGQAKTSEAHSHLGYVGAGQSELVVVLSVSCGACGRVGGGVSESKAKELEFVQTRVEVCIRKLIDTFSVLNVVSLERGVRHGRGIVA